jgi:hypothetical protein
MKALTSVIAVMAVLLMSGCGGDSAAGSGNAVAIDCAIEIQIAVVSGLKPGYKMTDGNWRVAAACVLPVHSTGGPGHVLSNTDGTIIELQWSDVRLIHDGTFIAFGGCEWAIKNRIDRRDGVKQIVGGRLLNNTTNFGTQSEWEWLGSCDLDTAGEIQSDRKLVIRARFLPKAPPAQPLKLAEMTGLSPKQAG